MNCKEIYVMGLVADRKDMKTRGGTETSCECYVEYAVVMSLIVAGTEMDVES